MRILALTNEQGNQVALVNKLSRECEIVGTVLSKNIPRKPPHVPAKARQFLNRLANRTAGREFVNTWFEIQRRYDSLYPELPTENVVRVDNVNDPGTLEAIEKLSPDLVVVSGTNLVGKKIIKAAQKRTGIINLHTGISPYVKGGPNCTNWCLAMNWFHLIGNTTMWLDAGIDTGNIIATEQTALDGTEDLAGLHWKVMEHAHDLYVRTVRCISEGKEVASVPQDSIENGTTFYNSDWNLQAMRNALRNFRNNYRSYFADAENHRQASGRLSLISIQR